MTDDMYKLRKRSYWYVLLCFAIARNEWVFVLPLR